MPTHDPIEGFRAPLSEMPKDGETPAAGPTAEEIRASDMAAIDAAIAAAAGETVPPAETPREAPTTDPNAAPNEEPTEPAKTDPPAETPPQTPPAETPPAQTPPADDPVATEMKDLGVKDTRAQDRFRALSADSKRLAEVAPRAENWDKLDKYLTDGGITGQDFGNAMNILRLLKSDDPVALNSVFDGLLTELTAVGRRIGREVPGHFDPLTDPANAELRAKVDDGLDRSVALDLIRNRHTTELTTEQRNRQAADDRARQERETAVRDAVGRLNDLGNQLTASDPHFAAKMEALAPTIELIKETVHPSQWLEKFQNAYLRIPTPRTAVADPPQAHKPPPLSAPPLRPTGSGGGNGMTPEIKSDMDAVEAGLAAAKLLQHR